MSGQKKIFYSIKEVSELFGVNQSLLRYWEKEFSFIKPSKTIKGTRQYKQEDIEAIRLVYHLVKEKGLTLTGAKQKLKEKKEDVIKLAEITNRLNSMRVELLALKTEFDEMEKQYNEAING
jgi:DNA-binding transcriptional MerR regulator